MQYIPNNNPNLYAVFKVEELLDNDEESVCFESYPIVAFSITEHGLYPSCIMEVFDDCEHLEGIIDTSTSLITTVNGNIEKENALTTLQKNCEASGKHFNLALSRKALFIED